MPSFEPQDQDPLVPPPRPTTPPVRRGFLLILLVLSVLAGLVYGIPYVAGRAGYAWEAGRARAAAEALAKMDKEGLTGGTSQLFRLAAVAVSPAVVHIQTRTFPHGNGPAVAAQAAAPEQGVGSGFVIDKDHGFIVTNSHVVRDVDEIIVRLSQGNEVPGRLVGADPKTDLAVVQIRADLKVEAQWGDSDKLDIGDWVLAIGSPFMLDHTVTKGIISATGRNNLPIANRDEIAYQDFIQTDAAINPGNSGGPLVTLNGKVVGINTAIFSSERGGFDGVGLAIPSNQARPIVEALIQKGRVIRGFLGVGLQDLTPALAQQLKMPATARGAVVNHVLPDSPAAKAGLLPGDTVTKIGDKDVADAGALRQQIAQLAIGSEVPIEVYRQGKSQALKVTIVEQPTLDPLGFRLLCLPPPQSGTPESLLIFEQVAPGTHAARAGLRPGMALVAVGGQKVYTQADFDKAVAAVPAGADIRLTVQKKSGEAFEEIVLPGSSR